jgi:hypothetical protein
MALVRAGIALKQDNDISVSIEISENGTQSESTAKSSGHELLAVGSTLSNSSKQPVFIQIATKGIAKPEYLQSTISFRQAIRSYRHENGDKLIVSVDYNLRGKNKQCTDC